MTLRLPPLTSLRAFEAAARHMSFAKAADELSVTPAALSYQIKSLEEHLGAPLFRRLNRAVELTEQGRLLAPGVGDGFARLADAWQSTTRSLDNTSLTITAGPAFTAKWLAPRLFDFAHASPDIELRFSATLRILDFVRDEIDVAIRFGLGEDEGLFSEALYRGWITPMMHPDLASGVEKPADLLDLPLIHDGSLSFLEHQPDWQRWFKEAGVETGPLKGTHFSQADHAVDAALRGNGVVLGRSSITLNALTSGALVAPFDLALTSRAHYRLVCPLGNETRPAIQRFRDWIHAEFRADTGLSEGRHLVSVD